MIIFNSSIDWRNGLNFTFIYLLSLLVVARYHFLNRISSCISSIIFEFKFNTSRDRSTIQWNFVQYFRSCPIVHIDSSAERGLQENGWYFPRSHLWKWFVLYCILNSIDAMCIQFIFSRLIIKLVALHPFNFSKFVRLWLFLWLVEQYNVQYLFMSQPSVHTSHFLRKRLDRADGTWLYSSGICGFSAGRVPKVHEYCQQQPQQRSELHWRPQQSHDEDG